MLNLLLLMLPFLAQGQDEKRLIGVDQRVQISSYVSPFHRSIGILQKEGGQYCTATLITQKHILTNAHCILKGRGFPNSIQNPAKFKFTPGKLSAKDAPYGVFGIVKIQTFRHYLDTGATTHDVAVLELNKRLSLPLIPRMRVRNESIIEFLPIKITGYSSSKPFGTLWEGTGITHEVTANLNRVAHDVDTLPGTSGSIIRARHRNSWVAVGIHRGSVLDLNDGVYFSPEIFDAINRWIKN